MKNQPLIFNDEVRKATDSIYPKVKNFIPEVEWAIMAPLIHRINTLKKEKNAVILAHNYMTPEIFHGIADIAGDSLALAREAANVKADIIILCGVHFMAETAKILNPNTKVLIADMDAGCSLAESITAADVLKLKADHPGVPVVTYVNTSAAVKAVTDVCCTSGNALEVVESLDSDEVIFIPDQYLAANIAKQTKKKIITWPGSCMVHEKFTPREILDLKAVHPGLTVMAHPECPPDVVAVSDYSGSTAQMIKFLTEKKPNKIALITECSMSDNVTSQFPKTEFIRPCNLCPHMKKITLQRVLDCLINEAPEVVVAQELLAPAKLAIDRMLAVRK